MGCKGVGGRWCAGEGVMGEDLNRRCFFDLVRVTCVARERRCAN